MKICKTCQFWSMEKKGFCHLDNRAVGQFWSCEHWQEKALENKSEKTKADRSCQSCVVQAH